MNHNELREEFLNRLKDCVDYDSDEKKINKKFAKKWFWFLVFEFMLIMNAIYLNRFYRWYYSN